MMQSSAVTLVLILCGQCQPHNIESKEAQCCVIGVLLCVWHGQVHAAESQVVQHHNIEFLGSVTVRLGPRYRDSVGST